MVLLRRYCWCCGGIPGIPGHCKRVLFTTSRTTRIWEHLGSRIWLRLRRTALEKKRQFVWEFREQLDRDSEGKWPDGVKDLYSITILWYRDYNPMIQRLQSYDTEITILWYRGYNPMIQRLQSYDTEVTILWCRDYNPMIQRLQSYDTEITILWYRGYNPMIQRLQSYDTQVTILWYRGYNPMIQKLQSYDTEATILWYRGYNLMRVESEVSNSLFISNSWMPSCISFVSLHRYDKLIINNAL